MPLPGIPPWQSCFCIKPDPSIDLFSGLQIHPYRHQTRPYPQGLSLLPSQRGENILGPPLASETSHSLAIVQPHLSTNSNPWHTPRPNPTLSQGQTPDLSPLSLPSISLFLSFSLLLALSLLIFLSFLFSEGFREICPAGPGYHYSASDLRYNTRPLGPEPPRVSLSQARAPSSTSRPPAGELASGEGGVDLQGAAPAP